MTLKKVLVSYLERNKVMTIPEATEDGDVKYVTKESRRIFNLDGCENVIIAVQKFDSEWEAFVDLEDDDAILNKDRLKVVVIPIPPSESNIDNSEVCCSSGRHCT